MFINENKTKKKKTRLAAIYQRDKELNHKKTAMQVYSGAQALDMRGCT